MSEELKEKLKHLEHNLVMGDGKVFRITTEMDDAHVEALLELFESYAKEIIGEDEPHHFACINEGSVFCDCPAGVRNVFRKTLRNRLESQKKA